MKSLTPNMCDGFFYRTKSRQTSSGQSWTMAAIADKKQQSPKPPWMISLGSSIAPSPFLFLSLWMTDCATWQRWQEPSISAICTHPAALAQEGFSVSIKICLLEMYSAASEAKGSSSSDPQLKYSASWGGIFSMLQTPEFSTSLRLSRILEDSITTCFLELFSSSLMNLLLFWSVRTRLSSSSISDRLMRVGSWCKSKALSKSTNSILCLLPNSESNTIFCFSGSVYSKLFMSSSTFSLVRKPSFSVMNTYMASKQSSVWINRSLISISTFISFFLVGDSTILLRRLSCNAGLSQSVMRTQALMRFSQNTQPLLSSSSSLKSWSTSDSIKLVSYLRMILWKSFWLNLAFLYSKMLQIWVSSRSFLAQRVLLRWQRMALDLAERYSGSSFSIDKLQARKSDILLISSQTYNY